MSLIHSLTLIESNEVTHFPLIVEKVKGMNDGETIHDGIREYSTSPLAGQYTMN